MIPAKASVLPFAETIRAALMLFGREVIGRFAFSAVFLFMVLSSAPKSSRVMKVLPRISIGTFRQSLRKCLIPAALLYSC